MVTLKANAAFGRYGDEKMVGKFNTECLEEIPTGDLKKIRNHLENLVNGNERFVKMTIYYYLESCMEKIDNKPLIFYRCVPWLMSGSDIECRLLNLSEEEIGEQYCRAAIKSIKDYLDFNRPGWFERQLHFLLENIF